MEYLEVFLAALAAFLLGFLWYTALFGKLWQKLTGITNEQAQKGMGITHGVAFLMMLLIAYFLGTGYMGDHLNEGDALHGAFHGMYNAVRFAVPLLVINYMYQKKPFALILIDGCYAIAFFTLIGAMIAILPFAEVAPEEVEEAVRRLNDAFKLA